MEGLQSDTLFNQFLKTDPCKTWMSRRLTAGDLKLGSIDCPVQLQEYRDKLTATLSHQLPRKEYLKKIQKCFDTEDGNEDISESQEALNSLLEPLQSKKKKAVNVLGGIDPRLYRKKNDISLDISLQYSFFDNAICIDIVKCYLEYKGEKLLYSKITLLRKGEEVKNIKNKAHGPQNKIDFSKEHKLKLKDGDVMDFELRVQIKKETTLAQRNLVISELYLGPELGQWKEMIQKPTRRVLTSYILRVNRGEEHSISG